MQEDTERETKVIVVLCLHLNVPHHTVRRVVVVKFFILNKQTTQPNKTKKTENDRGKFTR